MSKNDSVTVVVSSTDAYEDCWVPFFTFFSNYWPDCPYAVLLCTETKRFSFSGVNMRTVQVSRPEDAARGGRPDWGTCLHRTLEEVQSDYVLLLWDDFFLNGAVSQHVIERCLHEMLQNQDIIHITLTNHDMKRRSRPWIKDYLLEILPRSPYRISAGPALWRKHSLLSYIHPDESGWHFEIFGTLRSYSAKHELILRVNDVALNGLNREIIPYFWTAEADTAIVKGKWQKSVVPLFESHGLMMDWQKRGFYVPLGVVRRRTAMAQTLFSHPQLALRWIRLMVRATVAKFRDPRHPLQEPSVR